MNKFMKHLGRVRCWHSLTGLLSAHSACSVNEEKLPLPPRFLPLFTVLAADTAQRTRWPLTSLAEAASAVNNVPSLVSCTTYIQLCK